MGSVARRKARDRLKRADMLAFIDRQLDHLADGQTIMIRNMGGQIVICRDYAAPPPPEISKGPK